MTAAAAQGFSRDDADMLVRQSIRIMAENDPGSDEWITAASVLQVAVQQLVPVGARRWKAMRRQMLRMVQSFRYIEKESERILEAARHVEGCPAIKDRKRPCHQDCPDREAFLSALVCRANAEQFTILQSTLPKRMSDDYRPPPRELFDAICAELEVRLEAGDVIEEIERYIRENPGARAADAAGADTEPAPAPERPINRLVPVGDETRDADETDDDLEALADEDLDEDAPRTEP
ncbi:MAG TPA: hypothetical protein VMU47_10035 [Caldimonas sp.]|nr:hypothetical protein [Caldimonas sp.]